MSDSKYGTEEAALALDLENRDPNSLNHKVQVRVLSVES